MATKLLLTLAICRLIVTVGFTFNPNDLSRLGLNGKLSVAPADLQSASMDFGGVYRAEPMAVLHPATSEDVARLVKAAYDSARGFTVSARGHGHSINGQAMTTNGVVVQMSGGGGSKNKMLTISEKFMYADVWGGELWIDVLTSTLEYGLAPKSWTDYLYLTVGGTLSNAGISGQAFNHGPQISNVHELDVVTGKGELLTCSEKENSELFQAVLGGLGQFGIITRARIALEQAPQRVRWIRVLYSNFSTFTQDQEYLISLHGKPASQKFDYVEGFVIVDEGLINNWRSSFFSPSNPVKVSSLKAEGGVLYCLEITKNYHLSNADTIDQEIEILLKKLNYIPASEFTTDLPYVDFLDRVHKAELKLRSKGLWEVPHPWLNLFVPKSRIAEFDKGVFKGILGNKTSGPILIYPMNKNKMNPTFEPLRTRMVTIPDPYLQVWWKFMNNEDKKKVQRHIGHLPSLMEMVAYPDLIGTMVKFWDSDNMVFRFGEVELTPTIDEVIASYESVGMCNKRKHQPDTDLLFPKVWDFAEIKEKLSLVKAEWMDRLPGSNIPLRKLYYRFGRARAYEKFKDKFVSEEKWKETRPLAFAICLLGTMVFPQGPNYTIHPSVIMVTHAIFNGVSYGPVRKYYNLAPMILADIYRALDRCRNDTRFFQGCNLILQWWMMRHLIKAHDPTEPDPLERPNRLESHDWWVQRNHFNRTGGQEFWYPRLQGLREENVQWSIQCLVVTKQIVIRSGKAPYLIFVGLRGTRPYAPSRVLRQLGGKQELPQIEDMTRFVTDHENGEVAFTKKMLQLWKTRRVLGEPVPNRFRPECSKDYKEWLKKSLAGTIEPDPNVPHIIADVGAKHQIRLHQLQEKFDRNELEYQRRHSEDAKVITQLKQKLQKSRQCMSELDDSMEQQIQSVERFRHQEGARLARDHLWANKYAMWEEVSIAKRARLGERSG